MNYHRQDMFYENLPSHSPNPRGLQSQGYYGPEDSSSRFDNPRFGNDRMTAATMQGNYGQYEAGAQTWNAGAFGGNNMGPRGGTGRSKSSARGRNPLPSGWVDQAPPMPGVPSFLGLGGPPHMGGPPMRGDSLGPEHDEDLIPTAIVIKNIPFAVKKEQLVAIMTDLGLPLPYAFNYHFDNGIFRGLAFANFTSADETATVIDVLNHYELQGRKLRVEYKKMLPAAERERIEREKRERRGQLEEQHRPMLGHTLSTQPSLSSMSNMAAASPAPTSSRSTGPAFDMNDPETLEFYTKLAVFKERSDEVYVLPPNLTPHQRRIVHTLAHHMGMSHVSKNVGDARAVHVYKQAPVERLSPPIPQLQGLQVDSRRNVGRAATSELHDGRGPPDSGIYGLRQQPSQGYLPPFPNPNAANLSTNPNLRAAKSFADLRSYTPSPAHSTASFPASLANNVQRIQEQGQTASATPPNLPSSAAPFGARDDALLVNGLGNLNIGNGFSNSPRGLRGMMSWERGPNDNLGAIGAHRSFATGQYETQANAPGPQARQPRGPTAERGAGFPRRQNGHASRGSDELSQQSNPTGNPTGASPTTE